MWIFNLNNVLLYLSIILPLGIEGVTKLLCSFKSPNSWGKTWLCTTQT